MMEHESGCASSRQRPCTCAYLRTWDHPSLHPAPLVHGVINIDELFKSPAVQAVLDYLANQQRQRYTTLKVSDHRFAATPQRRDERRMGRLKKSALESCTITEKGVMLTVKWTKPNPGELHTSLNDTSPYGYLRKQNTYLRETARFYRQMSMYLLALLIPSSILATGAMLGWWW